MLIYNQNPETDISFLMTTGNGTMNFDVLLGQTIHMSDVGWMSWFMNLTSAGQDGQIKTIQMISHNNGTTDYLCVQVRLDATLTSVNETGTTRGNESYIGDDNTTITTTYNTDGLLANRSTPHSGAVNIPFTDEAALNKTITASSNHQSSGLGTGGKIGLGVGIPLGVILLTALAIIFFRRRKARQASKTAKPSKPTLSGEKPELHGSAYDPKIAGLVKPKPELAIDEHTRHEADSRLHPSATHPELPHPSFASANTPWAHSQEGYLPAELAHSPQESHQHLVGGGGPGQAATISSDTTDVAPSDGVTGAPQDPQRISHTHHDEVVASEADFLVQELGLISMRKKALTNAATSQGIRPEDAAGTRGEDYRELVEREARLRGRIADMDRRRGKRVDTS